MLNLCKETLKRQLSCGNHQIRILKMERAVSMLQLRRLFCLFTRRLNIHVLTTVDFLFNLIIAECLALGFQMVNLQATAACMK
jgi:hypothetical protein